MAKIANDHVAIVVDWYGPFSTANSAAEWERSQCPRGTEWLYMFIGRIGTRRKQLQYIGITGKVEQRFRQHPAMKKIERLDEIWLGLVETAGLNRGYKNPQRMACGLAEWIHVCLLRKLYQNQALPLNARKRAFPVLTVTLVNHWWHNEVRNGSNLAFKSFRRSPHGDWPYVLDFYGQGHLGTKSFGRMVWMDGSFHRMTRFS